MNETEISWTQLTWNPMSGCKLISAECEYCYADQLATQKGGTIAFPHGFGLTIRRHKLAEPARIKKGTLIFCNSMSDPGLRDEDLSPEDHARIAAAGLKDFDEYRDMIFDAIEAAPQHRYQMLTKRPGRMLQWLRTRGRRVPPSVWMGVTIGTPKTLARIDELRQFRDLGAQVLFISAEPLLGEIPFDLAGIDWIITGGESGTHASDPKVLERRFLVRHGERAAKEPLWVPREDRMDFVRKIRDEAAKAGCAHFFKQWGGPRPTSGGRILDGRTHDDMPVHVPGALPVGYEHKALSGKGPVKAEKRQLPMLS
jgi:protein gp37